MRFLSGASKPPKKGTLAQTHTGGRAQFSSGVACHCYVTTSLTAFCIFCSRSLYLLQCLDWRRVLSADHVAHPLYLTKNELTQLNLKPNRCFV